MTHRSIILVTLLIIVFVSNAYAAPDLQNERLTYFGLGEIKLGMTPTQVKNIGFYFTQEQIYLKGCDEVQLKINNKIEVMFEDGKITRISTTDPNILSYSGAHVGMSEQRAHEIYGSSIWLDNHKYIDGGHYLIVESSNSKYALVMGTDGKEIIELIAGFYEPAQYVEGCL